ncbi:chromosome transmission fidelity protein 18 homolog, partial [Limulus polyphemus]|uniref:Chromosome transmission fidelity protein 18 homolog n=1 Tax=Limulus polyphemus TaxID=6850 RepID=A0ABM1RXM6_LIMPO
GINRTLLHWLKLWDVIVFGRDSKHRLKGKENKKTGQQEKGKFFKRGIPDLNEELDDHKRPQHKIALLTGPPGLGKTTLAHVIAQHAGYNVVELNASDDRSPEVFTTQLEAATQMRAVIGQNCKPNCLVIDEIDGAPQAAINILVSLAKSTGPRVRGKRKKGEISLLLRPIICICNDQYVPALRPLRQIALVMNFPSIVAARLATRLHEITRQQWMRADMTALLALCEKAENDIRSCLSTLQVRI